MGAKLCQWYNAPFRHTSEAMNDSSLPASPAEKSSSAGLGWSSLSAVAQLYVSSVIAAGASLMVAFFPLTYADPLLFAVLLVFSGVTSAWKVSLPLPLGSGATLSVSYAADLAALLLLGPRQAMVIAVAGVWTQCTFNVRQRDPSYRTIFSMAAEAITIQATAFACSWLGAIPGPLYFSNLPDLLVGAIATYFFVNTTLIAGAIAFSTRQPLWRVWHDNFLWSGPSFIIAGTAGALAAVVIARGDHWRALLMLAPVYLTYRTYRVFLGWKEDEHLVGGDAR